MKRTLSVITLCVASLALAASLAVADGAAAAAPAKASTPAKSTMAATPKTVAPMVDLNTASREDLVKLPGVGEAIADKIIAGRPWTSKAQLLAKGVVTKAGYAKFKGMVVAKQAAK